MKTYEITFISKEDLDEKQIKDVLTPLGAKVLSVTLIGEKQLIYKIKKEDRGFYSSVLFEIEPEKITDINKKMALEEEIIRFLIVAKKPSQLLAAEEKLVRSKIIPTEIEEPKKIKVPEEIEEPKEIEKPKVIETIKEEKIEKKKEVAKPKKPVKKSEKDVKPKISKEVAEIETETESEEDRLKALDKKLDELLKE